MAMEVIMLIQGGCLSWQSSDQASLYTVYSGMAADANFAACSAVTLTNQLEGVPTPKEHRIGKY